MEIININGDLLNSTADLIIHQCNCSPAFGSGVALAVRNKYPIAYETHIKDVSTAFTRKDLLGKIHPVKVKDNPSVQYIVNMYGQLNCGNDGKRYTSYDAIYECLEKVKQYALGKGLKSVALPYGMSSVRGGASWKVILAMVESIFEDTEIYVEIWKL